MPLAELPAPESASASVIGAARDALAAAYGQPLWQCTDEDLVEEITAALALRPQADAVLLARLAEAESRKPVNPVGVPVPAGLAARRAPVDPRRGQQPGPGGGRATRPVPVTGAALGAGDISYGQARVIDQAIDTLSKDLPEAALVEGEQILLDQASTCDPLGLAGIGEQLFAVLDPVGYQQAQEDKVQTGERGAYAERGFTLTPDTIGSGSLIRGSGWVGGDAVIAAALDALAAPRPADDTGPDLRSAAARRYDALHELCRRSLHAAPSGSGDGGKVQLRVTVPLEVLEHRLTGTGSVLDTGQSLSPALARRLACDAQLIPVVLGTASQPLDVGQQQRCFTGARRIAVEERDGGCVMPGCSRPAAWCDVHHLLHWADGGPTALHNGALACGGHHLLFETGDWQLELINGRIWVRPPPTIDPDRKRRINHLHRPAPLRR